MRSAALGVPPRCTWPRMVTRDSRWVSSLELVGQAQRVVLMPHFKSGDGVLGLDLVVQGLGAIEFLLGAIKDARVVAAHGALGHGHNAEVAAALAALADGFGDFFRRRREFRE